MEHLWNKIDHLNGNFRVVPGLRATESTRFMERAMGIELHPKSLSLAGTRCYHPLHKPIVAKCCQIVSPHSTRVFRAIIPLPLDSQDSFEKPLLRQLRPQPL